MKGFRAGEAFKRQCYLMSSHLRLHLKCLGTSGTFKKVFIHVRLLMSNQVAFFFKSFGAFGALKRPFINIGALMNIYLLADIVAEVLHRVFLRLKCPLICGTFNAICVHMYILVTCDAAFRRGSFAASVAFVRLSMYMIIILVGKQATLPQKYS